MSGLKLGCIADDFTGATDLANNLVRGGMRVVQTIGVPGSADASIADVDAVVVALKSRTIAPDEAVDQSLAALRWLRSQGCAQFYFKVCSTFDSTPHGNIGPVAEALMDELGTRFACVTPAFPENARTVYKGHLFVGDVLLSESGMRHHPLTPMTDANLVRVMQAQCRYGVGLIAHEAVRQGPDAIRAAVASEQAQGHRFAIVDAIADADLHAIGKAIADMPLVVAGSGVAIGLPQNHGITPSPRAARMPPAQGHAAIVSGSCSAATNAQVQDFIARGLPAFAVDPMRVAAGEGVAHEALAWAHENIGEKPLLVYSTAAPEAVRGVQSSLGAAAAGEMIERTLADIAKGLVDLGVGRLVVAGGETSGAVVKALGIEQLRIGPQIDPGVPWCFSGIHVALKSGNFGATDFFTKAFAVLA
ncbi:MAG TPA: 3-oxo-tetronate kinase [Ramlibacter sp.]|nr:3-oxo-tetronate kinase [Ramlibacter sp.]